MPVNIARPAAALATASAWFLQWEFSDHSKFPLLWVDSQGDMAAEATYLIPYKPEQARKWRYGFLGFRFVRFSNGVVCIGWCKNCPCGQECGLDRELEGQNRQHCRKDFLGGGPHMCLLGQAFVRRLGGPAKLRSQLQRATDVQQGAGRLCISQPDLRNGRLSCTACRAGPRFRDWGVISSELTCATCASQKRSCCHISCLRTADREAAAAAAVKPAMQPAVYEQHLHKVFDINSGRRRLTCKSRLPVPEDLRHARTPAEQPICDALLKIYTGECKVAAVLATMSSPTKLHESWPVVSYALFWAALVMLHMQIEAAERCQFLQHARQQQKHWSQRSVLRAA
jgi:hypothetical protein